MDVLSPRELEVVQLIADGLTGKEAGERLGISESTVETHVEHVRDKLGARSRSHMVAKAMSMGLIALDESSEASSSP